MKFKKGVSLRGMKWQTFYAMAIVDQILVDLGYGQLVVTSGTEGEHKYHTHGLGYAFDGRNRDIPKAERAAVVKAVQTELGPDYNFIEEFGPDHFHGEYDPKVKEYVE